MTPAVRLIKRAIDIAGAAAGLALTLPLYPAVAIAIALESPGPILFRQRRAGELLGMAGPEEGPVRLRFREFEILKFRTMRPDAEAATGPVLASANDSRVTRVGRFLRKSRLDEVPQFWNVLRGEMSLVGPRPERPELINDIALAVPFFEERMRGVKPGITGLAQVSLGYTGSPPPGHEINQYLGSLTNPFKIDGAEGALADDLRMKLLYDLAYCAATEELATFLRAEVGILLRTPLTMLRAIGR
jgi:lipopolysaccharide/colanic/teichoic acid biosynthesis glycosyltransferase